MAAELETGLPSIRQIQTLIREQKAVEIKLTTNDVLAGKVRWQDSYCLCLFDDSDRQTIIWRSAIAYIKPIS